MSQEASEKLLWTTWDEKNVTASSLMFESIYQQQITIININHHVLNRHITIINYFEAPWGAACVCQVKACSNDNFHYGNRQLRPTQLSPHIQVPYGSQSVISHRWSCSPPGAVPRFHYRHANSFNCTV